MFYVLLSFLLISIVCNILLSFVAFRYAKRVLEFDELFSLIQGDLDENLENFQKLNKTNLLSDSPEIMHASKLMQKMRENLYEYTMRVQETSQFNKPDSN